MPWRKSRDPYAIWLSEIMLQQTQVETVKPYYFRFLERFPTVAHLAAASLDEVLALWSGLGYYRRAKHLHLAARRIVSDHSGVFPADVEQLRTLPGVGRYTAGAIASIAFNLPAPVVDGNVLRVLARLTGYDRDIAQSRNHEFFWRAAENVVRSAPRNAETSYGDVNQSLMELGATICVPPPARPICPRCPVRRFCRARAEGRQMELPVKSRRGQTPTVHATAVVLLRKRGTQVLLMQRPAGSLWEGMWEFPVLPGKPTNEMASSLKETFDVVSVCRCGVVTHQLSHRRLVYHVLAAEMRQRRPITPLPVCSPTEKPYTAARWVSWPLDTRGLLPIARIVHKIAAAVIEASASRR